VASYKARLPVQGINTSKPTGKPRHRKRQNKTLQLTNLKVRGDTKKKIDARFEVSAAVLLPGVA
jgi:hypothetical protein